MKLIKNHRITREIHKKNENHKIPYEKYENHENPTIPSENLYNSMRELRKSWKKVGFQVIINRVNENTII